MLTEEQIIKTLKKNSYSLFIAGTGKQKILNAADFTKTARQILLLIQQSKNDIPPQLQQHDVSGRSGQLPPADDSIWFDDDGNKRCKCCAQVL